MSFALPKALGAPRLSLLVTFLLLLPACYSLEQAYWFNNAYNSRVGVDDVLVTPDTDSALRQKLLLSREILQYADAEGLNTGGSYRHFIPERSAQVSYLVQAAEADRLEAKTWWFPFVGRVPYLGYFSREKRDEKAAALRTQGFDVSLGSVGAFSSLGWFDDPIYASMTKRRDADYVQLLFHELIHRTFWSKGSVAFNENLAEYLGFRLALKFLNQTKDGRGVSDLEAERDDQERLRTWLQSLKQELNAVYADKTLSRDEKLARKAQLIERFRTKEFPAMVTRSYASLKGREWNNASILGSALYSPDTDKFDRAYRCVGENKVGLFIAAIKKAESRGLSADEALVSLCPGEAKG